MYLSTGMPLNRFQWNSSSRSILFCGTITVTVDGCLKNNITEYSSTTITTNRNNSNSVVEFYLTKLRQDTRFYE